MAGRKIVKGFIEQIGTSKDYDQLFISNKPETWIFNIFNGYKQLGIYKVSKHHPFKERQWVMVTLDWVDKKFLFLNWKEYTIVDVNQFDSKDKVTKVSGKAHEPQSWEYVSEEINSEGEDNDSK